MTARCCLAWAMPSAVRPSSLRALTVGAGAEQQSGNGRTIAGGSNHQGGEASRMGAFHLAPRSISAAASSFEPEIDASIKGVYPPFRDGRVDVGNRRPAAPALPLTLPSARRYPSAFKPSLSVASSFAWCASSMLTNAGLSPHVAHMRGVQPLRFGQIRVGLMLDQTGRRPRRSLNVWPLIRGV